MGIIENTPKIIKSGSVQIISCVLVHWDFGSGKGKPARKPWVDTGLDLVPTISRGLSFLIDSHNFLSVSDLPGDFAMKNGGDF